LSVFLSASISGWSSCFFPAFFKPPAGASPRSQAIGTGFASMPALVLGRSFYLALKEIAMLVLTRKTNQQIRIGNDIVITVVKVRGNTIRLGIEAPQDVRVLRSELDARIEADAAQVESLVIHRPLNPPPQNTRRGSLPSTPFGMPSTPVGMPMNPVGMPEQNIEDSPHCHTPLAPLAPFANRNARRLPGVA
jgi:carbon storage regulator CsrA